MPAPKATPSRGPVHVVLRTTPANLPAMLSWYKTTLGLRPVHTTANGMMHFLTFDAEHHRLALIAQPDLVARPPRAVGLAHVAYTYASLRHLLEAVRERERAGVRPAWAVHHGVTISVYYADPDGNVVETQWDAMGAEDANAYLESAAFAENPIGVDFVPGNMLARLEAGEAEEVFRERGDVGARGIESVPEAMKV